MPNKAIISNFNAIEEGNTLTHDTRSILKIFKNFLSNLAESLLIKLLKPPDKYNLKSVIQYYSNFAITTEFCLVSTTEKQVLKIMQVKVLKLLKLVLRKVLKDGADVLAKPFSAFCNLSISRGVFPSACKVAKLKPIFMKGKKTDPSNCRPISLLLVMSEIIEKIVHDQKCFSFR